MRIPSTPKARRALPVAVVTVALAASACGLRPDRAEEYPARDVQVVVPYPAGSGIDTTTRALVDIVNDQGDLGQRLQVVNKEGGAGSVGTTSILNAEPDGYTIGVVPDGPLTLVPQTEDVAYDPNQITVLSEIITSPIMFVVPDGSPYQNMDDLIAAATADPSTITIAEGPLNYAIPADKVEQETEARFKHVDYDGDGATTTALLGNNVDVGVMQLASALPQLESGQLRALAITSADEVDMVPDVPTFKSLGIDLVWDAYNVAVAPDGLPSAVEDELVSVIDEAANSPEFADAAEALGLIVSGADPAEATAHLEEKYAFSSTILEATR